MTPAQAAERAICGALIQDTQDAAHWRAVRDVGLQQGDLLHPLHQAIWVAVHALRSGGRPADLITIGAELQHLPIYQLREYGAAYLAALTLEAPASPESTAAHVIVVRRHAIWLAREQLGHEIARSPHDPSLVLRAQQLHLAESTLGSRGHLPGMIEAIGEDWGRPLPPVEPTGLRDLDQAMGGGLRAESCCVVLGATGQGKSGLVLQMARSIARRRRVLVITSELSRRQVEARLLAQELRRPWRDIYEMGPSALPDLLHAAGPLAGMAVDELRRGSRIRELVDARAQAWGAAPVVVLDYLQHAARRLGADDPRLAVMALSQEVTDLARELRTQAIVVSAIGRSAAKEDPALRTPLDQVSAGAESSAIEFDAGHVLFLEAEQAEPGQASLARLGVAKSRFSSAGTTIGLRFLGALGLFEPDAEAALPADLRECLQAVRATVDVASGLTSTRAVREQMGVGTPRATELLRQLARRRLVIISRQGITLQ